MSAAQARGVFHAAQSAAKGVVFRLLVAPRGPFRNASCVPKVPAGTATAGSFRARPFDRGELTPRAKYLRNLVLAAALYYGAAEAAFFAGTLSDKIFAPFWPPNTVLFGVFLLVPWRSWWIYVLAILPAHALAELGFGMHLEELLLAFATNVLVAAMNAAAVRCFLPDPPSLRTVRHTLLYILATVVVSPALVALAGAFVRILGAGTMASYGTFWMQWYASNALGSATLGALFIAWHHDGGLSPLRLGRILEPLLLAFLLIGVCIASFGLAPKYAATGFLPAILYAPLPVLMWITVRFGTRGATAAILLIILVSIIRGPNGSGTFVSSDVEANVLAFQLSMIGLAIPLLLLGASIEQARDAERSVIDREDQITFAAETANIGFWHIDLATDKLWLSDHCAAMLSLGANEPSREAVFDVVHPGDRENVKRSMRYAVHDGKLLLKEFRCVMPDGEVKWFLVRSHPERNEHGRIFRLSGFFADITAQKVLEAEAAVKNKELAHLMRVSTLGELSGAIAHELHQPLTAILSNAQAAQELITQRPSSLDKIIEILEDIVVEDARASDVIDRMRRLMKKTESKYESVDVNALLEATLTLLHSDIIQRRIKIETALTDPAPTALADPIQLQQVFLNLIVNASDAMGALPPADRILSIVTRPVDRNIEVIISDRGSGLQGEARHRAFESFFTTKQQGLGLGLTICSTIVSSHGGTIQLANNAGGKGAKAIVRLPANRRLLRNTAA